MRESDKAYLPRDRLEAIKTGRNLPDLASGSVLFADISGFTPLTEAFEKHLGARRGGEELTRVLNEVYALLIDEVDRMRGSVIGFAGDAITCWFGEDDGTRATLSGLAMQKVMDLFQEIPSPDGGKISLGLKAAATVGTVRRFVIGNEDIQLVDVLAGDPVYRVAQTEQLAERGEVLVDAIIRQNLGERLAIKEERLDEEGNTAYVVESLEIENPCDPWPALETVEIPQERVIPWLVSAMRERMQTGHSEFLTELRPATALFLKFGGIDFEGDPRAGDKLDAFFTRVQEIVNEYEGVVHQLTIGDKGSFLYAAFGAPVSHEDDTRRTLAASRRIVEFGYSEQMIDSIQVGLGRGTTRAGAYGGPTRRTYGVLGDQVNLAARLMGKAKPRQILMPDHVATEVEAHFHLKKLPPIKVKGKADPVVVFELADEGEKQGGIVSKSGYVLPMVGRRKELMDLAGQIRKAEDGLGQAAIIEAEAGMGKTRLADEVIRVARAKQFKVLQGECQTFGTNTSYTPWWPVWRKFFGIMGNEFGEEIESILFERLSVIHPRAPLRLPLLADVLNLEIADNELTKTFDAKLRRTSLESLLVECLRTESMVQPLLIVLENVHAMDAVSRNLLRSFIQAVARLNVMFLVVQRPGATVPIYSPAEEGLEYTHVFRLQEFSEEESHELISLKFFEIQGPWAELPIEVAQRICDRTGGNPFFIEEVMNWLHHNKVDFTSADALDTADLPVSLYALVLSRMDQIEENARVTLKVASVAGRLFRASIIWGAYPEIGKAEAVCQTLDFLSNEEFMERNQDDKELVYLFKHVVIHEVAYESLPVRLREKIHESIGTFIERSLTASSTEALDLLAFHFGRSTNTAKKREYFLLAGDASRKAYASEAAARYYIEVMDLLEEPDQIAVRQNLGHVQETSGDWKSAMVNYEKALQLSKFHERPLDQAGCRLAIGDLFRKVGKFEEARDWLDQAKTAFERLDDKAGIGQVIHSLGTLAAQGGDYDLAKMLYSQSMAVRQELGDESKVASLMSNVGIIERFQGNLETALDLQQKSLAIRRRLNDPWAIGNSLNNLGMAKRYTGDLDGARKNLEEALVTLRKVGDRSEIANTLNSLAEVALDQQDSEACEGYLQKSLRLTRELGNMRAIAFVFEAFASNAFFLKDPLRCLRLFGAAKKLREDIGAPLPDSDLARIEETIDLASNSIRGIDAGKILQEGASLPLSTALDVAAGIKDSEL